MWFVLTFLWNWNMLPFFCDIHNQSTFTLSCKMFVCENFYCLINKWICITFSIIKIKRRVEHIVIFFDFRNRKFSNFFVDCIIRLFMLLYEKCIFVCKFFKFFVIIFSFASFWIFVIKQIQSHIWKRQVFKIWLSVFEKFVQISIKFQLQNCKSHLKTIISQMHISQSFVTHNNVKSFESFANNRRTQMSNMQLFCDIRTTIVKKNQSWTFHLLNAKMFIFQKFVWKMI